MKREMDSGACREYEARQEDSLSGQLSGADAEEVAEHLETCGACSAALADARASVNLLHLAEPPLDPDPGFSRIVMARIRTELNPARESRGLWQPFVALAWRFAATATVALALMVTYDVVASRQQPASRNTASVQAGDMRDLFTTDADRIPANRDDVLIMVAEENHGKH
jgi:anti-sigma factor RsiW